MPSPREKQSLDESRAFDVLEFLGEANEASIHLHPDASSPVTGNSDHMKRIRLDRWAVQLQPPRNPRLRLHHQQSPFSHETPVAPRRELQQRRYRLQPPWQSQRRHAASGKRGAASAVAAREEEMVDELDNEALSYLDSDRQILNSPSPNEALRSAKLSALHSRLSLPSKLPLQTLARCLIDPTVDSRPGYNNAPFALIGQDLLGYYTTEWLLCHYPRLPMSILFAAQYGYVGSQALAAMRGEWGVEVAAAPGREVDAGLLQLRRVQPGNAMAENNQMRIKDMPGARRVRLGRRDNPSYYRRGLSSRIVYDDEFGDVSTGIVKQESNLPISEASPSSDTYPLEGIEDSVDQSLAPEIEHQAGVEAATVEDASASFVRALAGALYLHAGRTSVEKFHREHVLSRSLPLHTLFHFTHPTRDLSRLCAREGFEPPVARLISETGRLSRTPVFVVGVYSGEDKLGEAAGSSLNEGRVRAAAAALRAWYLYSPPEEEIVLPSETTSQGKKQKQWKPQMIDVGEVVT